MNVVPASNEDKLAWCKLGQTYEDKFVSEMAPRLGLDISINPEKETNRYAHDLVLKTSKETLKAELKHQSAAYFATPFNRLPNNHYFLAFNEKDYLRYQRLYPDLVLFFWLEWQKDLSKTMANFTFQANPITGVWAAKFSHVVRLIEEGRVYRHVYPARVNDKNGNNKVSYILNMAHFACLWAASPLVEHRALKGIADG